MQLERKMREQQRHEGIVVSVKGGIAHVRIAEQPSCEDCKAASLCHSAQKTEKYVDAVIPAGRICQEGDNVTVVGALSMGMRAACLAFGIPLILMVIGIVTGIRMLGDETIGALAGIAVLVPYYLGLWFFRRQIGREFVFRVV